MIQVSNSRVILCLVVDLCCFCCLQKQYYRAIFERNREFLCRPAGAEGKVRGPRLLNMESQLRKCCNHPYLLDDVEERETVHTQDPLKAIIEFSGKMVRCLLLCVACFKCDCLAC